MNNYFDSDRQIDPGTSWANLALGLVRKTGPTPQHQILLNLGIFKLSFGSSMRRRSKTRPGPTPNPLRRMVLVDFHQKYNFGSHHSIDSFCLGGPRGNQGFGWIRGFVDGVWTRKCQPGSVPHTDWSGTISLVKIITKNPMELQTASNLFKTHVFGESR